MNKSKFNYIAAAIIIAAGVLLYAHTLPFPFVFDDDIYLVENPLVMDIRSFVYNRDFVAFSTYSKRLGLDPDLSTNFILRPVTYLTFYINYVFDEMRPQGFRAVNIAIHCANALLVFAMLSFLINRSRKSGSVPDGSQRFIALAAALLFLAHPLQTESVTYIVQRFTSLAAFFYLLTILAYLVAHSTENRTVTTFFRCVSVASLLVGMLVKESLFTAPFMLAAIDCLVMGIPWSIVWRRLIPHFLCLPVIPALILLTSWAQESGQASVAAAFNITNPYADPYYQYYYALTQLSAVLTYLRLILVPCGQNLDWDYPLSKSILDQRVLGSAAMICGILMAAWWLYFKQRNDARRSLIFCGVIWYFVTLADSSSIVPLPDLFVEHRCYIASLGALTALTSGLDMLRTLLAKRQLAAFIVPTCAAAWILALCAATFARNEVWRSTISIWTDAAVKSPKKLRPLTNLGNAYVQHEKPREAIACYRRVLQNDNGFLAAYINIAVIENTAKNHAEALLASLTGLECNPQNAELHFTAGWAYDGLGQTQSAMNYFKKAIALCPTHKKAHMALGLVYAHRKQYDDALKHYRIAVALPTFREFDAQIRFGIANAENMIRRDEHPVTPLSNQP